MEVARLKTGENDKIKKFLINSHDYKKEYESFLEIKNNVRNCLFLLYFFIPLIFDFFFPNLENYILFIFIIFSIMSFKLIGDFAEFLAKFFLSKIITTKMEKALFYEKNRKKLKESVSNILKQGSDQYSEDLLREFLR